MTIAKAKQEYNLLLKRFDKANQYFENTKVSQVEKENQLKNFEVILNGLNYLLTKIGSYTKEEVLGGFDIG